MDSQQCRGALAAAGVILSILLAQSSLFAQYTTASLGGTVADETGAVIPGAEVTATNIDTGLTETKVTDDRGAYLFPRLPTGNYKLIVGLPGFRTYVQSGIRLAVNRVATQNITLQVGEITEQVTVQAGAELLETRTATAGQLVEERSIRDLPLEGRRPERLIYLAAGTVDLGRDRCRICGHGGVYPGEETAGVNGAGMGQVNFQLDATGHNDTYLNASLPFPNPDAIEEFNLMSSNFTAEYGMAAGGVVNIVTKSGTNEVHGSLFHFHRNGALNARQFFAPEADSLIRNQFGGSVGGPIVKDKLFFFGTYQGTRIRETPGGIIQFVPTARQREGDFSDVPQQLIDPVSKEPFPNNQIPAARLSPVSKFFLDWMPLPNGPDGELTFTGTPIVEDEDQLMTKIDFITGEHQLSGRYFFTDFDAPPAIPTENVLAASSGGNAV
ncbi:MAG: carboxypeptidase regulatory-like domain-containing protein, partial [Acidobacteriota bacterium]